MKQNLFLIHYGEIALKGKNRPLFEKQLADNIRLIAQKKGVKTKIKRLWGRLLATTPDNESKLAIILEKTFGIEWFAPVLLTPLELNSFQEALVQLAEKKHFSSFAIRAKVADRSLPFKRRELEVKLGHFIQEKFQKPVCLSRPALTFYLEIADKNHAFLFTQKKKGLSGLPPGISGKALCLLSGGIDSPVAGWKVMGRGLKVNFVHYHSYPQTDKASVNKAIKIVKVLAEYQPQTRLYLVPLLSLQKKILTSCQPRFLVLLYRRAMLRISELLAQKEKSQVLITGDALGQVASQTVENLIIQDQAVQLPVIRPLISFGKLEIVNLAQKIGTYSLSILPHQDCCSLFLPKNPATKAKIEDILAEEEKFNWTEAVKDCVQKTQIINL